MPILRSNKDRPRVAITIGDPAGIGPEVVVKALASPEIKGLADFFVVGDRRVLKRVSGDAGVRFDDSRVVDIASLAAKSVAYGVRSAVFGRAAISYIDGALRLLKDGAADCLVTAPVNKASIRSAARFADFQGHTEYLASRTATKNYAMMFVGKSLKVSLVTRHIPLADVSGSLTAGSIQKTIELTGSCLKDVFGLKRPRIAVLGLNPHAGEGGAFGREEERVIIPAIEKAGGFSKGVYGPIPADVAFHDCLSGKFDACVAMYHDQALAPFKMLYFKDGVNMTIGLPFIRTSPDHGTAFDIAGKAVADPTSMMEAIRLACRLSKR